MVDYSLTPFGETLVRALLRLCEWATLNRQHVANVLLTA
jgi:DNA-binding HxlR family transcriptional regulator